MKVLFLLHCFLVLLLCPGDVTGQFTAAPPACPGDTFTFNCTVDGDRNGVTIWRVGGSSECTLVHRSNSSSLCGPNNALKARAGTGFGSGTRATSFTSTLNGTATSALNDTLIECNVSANRIDPGNRVGSSTLHIIGSPSIPTLSCVDLSGDVSGAVNVTVSWTLSGGDSADFYLINITTNALQTPYGGLLNITTASVTQHELTGFMTGYEYNITVRGVNCGSQEGGQSEPLKITPQVPTIPTFDVCAVYDMDETLQIIESSWNAVETVTISEDCANGQHIRASYELSYTTNSGTHIATCAVDGTECSNGVYHHELQSNTADSRCQPPVTQFNGEGVTVSVTARNIVGKSDPAVSRSINGRNIDLGVTFDTTNLSNAFVECTLNQPVYNCTIAYGTDPSYTDLVYRDTSSTQGRMTTINLSQRLRGYTTYYYIVSAESNSHCVRVRGRFQTGCMEADLTGRSGTANPGRCADKGFVNSSHFSSGVVCYNGTAVGSKALYICNDGFVLMEGGETTRVCQSDGSWNGSIPQCIREESDQIGGIVGGVFGSFGGVLLLFFIILIVVVVTKHKKGGAYRPEDDETNEQLEQEMTPLHIAAKQGHKNSVERLLNDGTDINITDNDMKTPLHIAATEGHDPTVEYLVERGADINFKDIAGQTPLHIAARENYSITVKVLVDKKADINIRDNDGMTPLHMAAKGGHKDTVEYLINKGADIGIKDVNGMVPLHIAAEKGRYKIVGCLLGEKADVNIKDHNQRAPLHIAAEGGHLNTVKSLVREGADINIKDKAGMTPLEVACKRHHGNVARYLQDGEEARPKVEEVNDQKEWTPLHIAVREGQESKVEYLVKQGANVNSRDKDGMTPLHVAAERCRCEKILGDLVDKGADINTKDNKGWTPLHIAVREGEESTVECIVEKGADINVKDKNGWTPLHVAAERGRCEKILGDLVDKGGDINTKDNKGRTPLHIAVREGQECTVECLVDKKADITNKDNNGMTPLHIASEKGDRINIVKCLVGKADINIKDVNGQTPLHIAVREGHELTVKSLVSKRADVNIRDNDGMTPLHVAAKRGDRINIVKCLVGQPGAADINIKDNNGRTPLHTAAREGHKLTAECLVNQGADISIKDNDGKTPQDVADERGHRSIAEFLVGAGMSDQVEARPGNEAKTQNETQL